jgi:cell shape-determining protein MreC
MLKAGFAAAAVAALLIFLLLGRPVSGFAKVVMPVANTLMDGVSWPARLAGRGVEGVRELASAKKENKKLRALLDDALARNNECDLALAENQDLLQKLEIVRAQKRKVAAARVLQDNSAIDRSGFRISKGAESGIKAGMAVVSFDGFFVGVVSESWAGGASVRGIRDSKSNIPVRIIGTDVFGFLRGSGRSAPELEFLSDPEFELTDGLHLATHGIKGNLPDGIPVGRFAGKFIPGTEIGKLSEVMVIEK